MYLWKERVSLLAIPQSSFCLFRLECEDEPIHDGILAIPQSGFRLFQHIKVRCMQFWLFPCNPAIGLLPLPTQQYAPAGTAIYFLQSRNRASASSDLSICTKSIKILTCNPAIGLPPLPTWSSINRFYDNCKLAIPQSGFCLFRLRLHAFLELLRIVAIPQSRGASNSFLEIGNSHDCRLSRFSRKTRASNLPVEIGGLFRSALEQVTPDSKP